VSVPNGVVSAVFERPGELLAQEEHLKLGAFFLPVPAPLPEPFAEVLLVVTDDAGTSVELPARVLQIMGGARMAIAPAELPKATATLAPLFARARGMPPSEPGEVRVFWGRNEAVAAPPEVGKGEDAVTLAAQIEKMAGPQRIQLALKGDHTARMILLRDTNKTSQVFVLKNPRVTSEEVRFLAGDRQANPEALTAIAANREWIQNANILWTLVRNPKTPSGVAVKLLDKLSVLDLRRLAKSSDVPGPVQAAARKRVNDT
jgi:hypothetical protein